MPVVREVLLVAEVLRNFLVGGLGVGLLLPVAVLNAPDGILVQALSHSILEVVLERNDGCRSPLLRTSSGHLKEIVTVQSKLVGTNMLPLLESAVAHLVEEVWRRSLIVNRHQIVAAID